MDGNSEVIFINDGSYDASLEILIKLRLSHPEIKIISLSRNFGHRYISDVFSSHYPTW
ncbi:glycosyltransferase [Nostoc sp.]|uniref:glycosyltransferase n=1 Tax=Nostoc sp. TaxID=1180 RepID=UPI003FA5804D